MTYEGEGERRKQAHKRFSLGVRFAAARPRTIHSWSLLAKTLTVCKVNNMSKTVKLFMYRKSASLMLPVYRKTSQNLIWIWILII